MRTFTFVLSWSLAQPAWFGAAAAALRWQWTATLERTSSPLAPKTWLRHQGRVFTGETSWSSSVLLVSSCAAQQGSQRQLLLGCWSLNYAACPRAVFEATAWCLQRAARSSFPGSILRAPSCGYQRLHIISSALLRVPASAHHFQRTPSWHFLLTELLFRWIAPLGTRLSRWTPAE